MAQRAEAPSIAAPGRVGERPLVVERWFPLGVALVAGTTAAFLLHQLMAWPPHEDETLALFLGRDSLAGLLEQVTRERGGAPLHFALAWIVAHLDLGLGTLRLLSAAFAVASVPLVALLGRRLHSAPVGLVAAVLAASSWALLFHGVYARMYSLFLCTSLVSLLLLLRTVARPGRAGWAWWAVAAVLCVATHPYGALVLGGQAAYMAVAHRDRWRTAGIAFGGVLVLCTPFWLSDLVLAERFDVGVGSGGSRLGGPWTIVEYLWRTAGDFSAGWSPVLTAVLGFAVVGLVTGGRQARLLFLAMFGVPVAAFLAARLGGAASPESRHLIFLLPLFAVLTATGIVRLTRRAPQVGALLVVGLVVAQVSWAWHRTSPLFEWEPDARQAARKQAEDYLAATSRPDDVLFGYEPLYLGAWERNPDFPTLVLPRADARLAQRKLEAREGTLGRGTWVLDASERNNPRPRLEIELRDPGPPGTFETRRFGPFLVIRTRQPVVTAAVYLGAAGRAMLLGRSLRIGDADVNLLTIERAERAVRGYGASAWLRSTASR